MKTVITALILAATLTSTQAFAGFSSVEEIQVEAQNFCDSYSSSSDSSDRLHQVRYLGAILVETDVYRSTLPFDSKARKLADQIRNELDFLQFKMTKAIIPGSAANNELNDLMIQFCK